jgi:hypothetical protein
MEQNEIRQKRDEREKRILVGTEGEEDVLDYGGRFYAVVLCAKIPRRGFLSFPMYALYSAFRKRRQRAQSENCTSKNELLHLFSE